MLVRKLRLWFAATGHRQLQQAVADFLHAVNCRCTRTARCTLLPWVYAALLSSMQTGLLQHGVSTTHTQTCPSHAGEWDDDGSGGDMTDPHATVNQEVSASPPKVCMCEDFPEAAYCCK